ncbi:MAG: hypothetical protein WKF36_05025 [Candidatus Nitrosocosmicus sp.]
MDKEGILSATGDWIKISIKFSGVCLHCKKRLNSGEYGYWSKDSKSILHETCYDSLLFPFFAKKESSSDNAGLVTLDEAGNKTVNPKNKEGDAGNNANRAKRDGDINGSSSNGNSGSNNGNNDYGSSSILSRKRAKNTKCFICSNNVDFDSDLIISLLKLAEGYNCNSDVLYCHACLENPSSGVYENYKKKFMNAL